MRFTTPLLAFLICSGACLSAQSEEKDPQTPLLTFRDTLMLSITNGKKIVLHPVKAKQTLFSISRYYSISLEELYEYNPQFRSDPSLRTGEYVKIPIPNLAIKRYRNKKFITWKNIPIYYKVEEGDNLYQICKRNFDMPVDTVMARNGLKNTSIRPGQLLLIAWMGREGVKPEWRPARAYTEGGALKGQYEQEKTRHKEVDSQGVCYWQKDSKEKGDLYALHREAPVGSIIQVINPMGNRTVYAKVIGKIPEGYERNIEIILSPEAARKIGARDPKFFVRVKYLK
ncbi:MAG: LysM peptidoglycan-binding domain-containing protein [Saprospiraceae bacterium]|nr:LysM peptidoglycan-binding domain-containing protein [Saprospiraceae bacterium]